MSRQAARDRPRHAISGVTRLLQVWTGHFRYERVIPDVVRIRPFQVWLAELSTLPFPFILAVTMHSRGVRARSAGTTLAGTSTETSPTWLQSFSPRTTTSEGGGLRVFEEGESGLGAAAPEQVPVRGAESVHSSHRAMLLLPPLPHSFPPTASLFPPRCLTLSPPPPVPCFLRLEADKLEGRHFGEASCREYRESVMHVLPHSWTHPLDTWLQVCVRVESVDNVWI